ncbi:integrase/recombinase xerD homolog [Mytilus galloprovincialis]|uniref:integrase/recombinase xerD homolog n=1 Tax=Mytilus galloprovincialis TaxID=29158 RepID=UPI003F7BFDFF
MSDDEDITFMTTSERQSFDKVKAWASVMKLTEATADAIVELGFSSMEALSLIEANDLVETNIPIGQKKLLLKAIKKTISNDINAESAETTSTSSTCVQRGGIQNGEFGNASGGSKDGGSNGPNKDGSFRGPIQDGGAHGSNKDGGSPEDYYIQAVMRQLASQQKQQELLPAAVNSVVNDNSMNNLGLQARREVANLDNLVDTFRSYTYAESTKKTYQTYLNSYKKFCALVNIPLVPLSKENLARYIAFLSQKLCFNSISNYISIIKLLHLEAGQPPPIDSHYIHTILQGAKRVLGTMVKRKLPITPQLLKKILTTLDLQNQNHISFWAACLVAFFSFFRKSNLFVPTLAEFDAGKHLSRQDIVFQTSGTLLRIRKSKTIQFANRLLEIPLPRIPNSPLCPSQALLLHVKMIPAVSCPSPAFLYISKGTTVPLTYSTFLQMLKHSLSQLELDTSGYSGHSFRRGGATFALECGVSSDLIQAQGDWKSEAYKGYLDPSFSHKQQVMNAFASALSQKRPSDA